MAGGRLNRVTSELAALLAQRGEGPADEDLLRLFVRQRDEAAFEALVRRHGPMVFGVCRRVLGHEQDAEDAFQATFLVLARKAASVRPRGRVGNWLYGVAYRTAMVARRSAARRRAREARAVPRGDASEAAWDDLREVLDRELAALPDRSREVIVLCDLQGRTRKEAARQLGCPEGTVATRLARARKLLAKRLARYGLATAAVAAGLSREASSACVPAPLVSSTARAAVAGVVPTRVLGLVEKVVRTMLVMKLRALTPVLLVAGLLGVGGGWLCYHRAVAAPPGEGERSERESLRQEMDLLRADLRRATERAAALEAKLKGADEGNGEVFYQGKPPSFWLQQLKDRDREYRVKAVQALGHIAEVDRAVIPALVSELADGDGVVRTEAVAALARAGKKAVPYLIAALKEGDDRTRAGALHAARRLGPDALARVGPDAEASAVPALIDVLKGPDQDERPYAASALGVLGPRAKAAVPALVALVRGGDRSDRYYAAQALGNIGPEARAAVPALLDLLNDPLSPLYCRAAEALGKIGPDAKAAVPVLIENIPKQRGMVLNLPEPPLFPGTNAPESQPYLNPDLIVAEALGRIGPDAKAAVPVLLELARGLRRGDETWEVVTRAIEKIDPEAAAKVKRPGAAETEPPATRPPRPPKP